MEREDYMRAALALAHKMRFAHTDINDVPRQDFVHTAFAVRVKLRVYATLFKGVHPALE